MATPSEEPPRGAGRGIPADDDLPRNGAGRGIAADDDPPSNGAGRGIARFANDLFWVLAIGVILVYAFFLVLGALAPGDVWALSLVVVALVALYAVRVWWQSRHPPTGKDPRIVSARERRGF